MTTIRTASVDKDGKVTPVTVEVEIKKEGVGIHLVGLADAAVKETLLRTVTALQAKGFHFPGKKIVINLAPTDKTKNGSGYDLPIALGILAESGQIDLRAEAIKAIVYGQLDLMGNIRATGKEGDIARYIAQGGKGVLITSCFACKTPNINCSLVGFSELGMLSLFVSK